MAGKIRVTNRDPGTISPIRNEKATREEVWTAINSNEYRDLIAEIGRLLAELRKNNAASAHLAKAQEMLNRKMSAEHALGVGMGQYSRYQRGYTRSGFRYTQTIDTTPYYKAIKNNKGLDESFRRQYTKVMMWDHQFTKKVGALGRAIYKQHLTHPTIQTAKLVDIVTKLGALTQTAGTAFMSRPHSLQMGNWNKKRANRTYFTEQNDAFVAAVDALRARGVGGVPNTFMPSGLSIPGGTGPGGMFSYQGSLAQKLGESSKTELASQFAPLFMRSLTDAIENTPNDDMAVAISEKITDGIKKVGMESAAKQALINTFGLKRRLIPKTEWGAQLLLNALNGIPHYADGGVVNKGTIALVGEAGPEIILPLKKIPHYANGQVVNGQHTSNLPMPTSELMSMLGIRFDPNFGVTSIINGNKDLSKVLVLYDIAKTLVGVLDKNTTIGGAMNAKLKGVTEEINEAISIIKAGGDAFKQMSDANWMLSSMLDTFAHNSPYALSEPTERLVTRDDLKAMAEALKLSDEQKARALKDITDKLGQSFAAGKIDREEFASLLVEMGFSKNMKAGRKDVGQMAREMFDTRRQRAERRAEDRETARTASSGLTDAEKGMRMLFDMEVPESAFRNTSSDLARQRAFGEWMKKNRIRKKPFDPTDPKWDAMRLAADMRKSRRAVAADSEPDISGLTYLISHPSEKLHKPSFKDKLKEKTKGLSNVLEGILGGDVSKAKGITGKLSVAIGNKASSMLGAGKLAGGALLGGIALGVGSIVALLNKLVKASPVLQGVLDLFNLAVNMLLMPLGNAIGERMLPAVLEMVNWAVEDGGPALVSLIDIGQNLWNIFSTFNIDPIIGFVEGFQQMFKGDIWGGLETMFNKLPIVKILTDFFSSDTGDDFKRQAKNMISGDESMWTDSLWKWSAPVAVRNLITEHKWPWELASGGLVMGTPLGTPALLGEGGQSELVVPLDEVQETFNGGRGITIVFQGPVYGMNDFKRTVTDIASEAINSARYR